VKGASHIAPHRGRKSISARKNVRPTFVFAHTEISWAALGLGLGGQSRGGNRQSEEHQHARVLSLFDEKRSSERLHEPAASGELAPGLVYGRRPTGGLTGRGLSKSFACIGSPPDGREAFGVH
jgi:hypothetical protein